MKYIKLFENFNSLDPRLVKFLKIIVTCYKTEVLGSTEHISEYFGEGDSLRSLSQSCGDERIASILNRVADASMEECGGSSVYLIETIGDSDCDYIAQFLGLPSLSYEEDWTREEEDNWYNF